MAVKRTGPMTVAPPPGLREVNGVGIVNCGNPACDKVHLLVTNVDVATMEVEPIVMLTLPVEAVEVLLEAVRRSQHLKSGKVAGNA